MNEVINQDIAQTLLNAGASLVGVRALGEGGKPLVIIPDGYRVDDAENLLASPIRKRAAITVTDSQSFIAYLNTHAAGAAGSTIYAAVDSEKSHCYLRAIVDDHGAGEPHWRDHSVSFTPKLSVEWKRWIDKNGAENKMSQTGFATWLEDNLPDIATVEGMPTGAEILAMSLGFEANSDKRLRSKVNLQSGGVTFEFVDQENNDTRTTMKVFERFTLGIPVFDGSIDAYPLEARLKYRESQGKLVFWYELIRPDRVFKTAVTAEVEAIKEGTKLPVIFGKTDA